ncbi:tetratricopeptide repeat protein [Clostridium sediminicola]|uniref:tetratricopeptide repeat protein n=1 Tax=Clostridium sediminicola TaxID=3114879 RepID=UPI0031F2243F
MNIKAKLKEKLSSMLFITLDNQRIKVLFNTEVDENIYMPIGTESLVEDIKNGKGNENISLGIFIEGMFSVLGIDDEFKHNNDYIKLIKSRPESIKYIKGKIAQNVKENNLEEAYILLNGLIKIEGNLENYNKLLTILDSLRVEDKAYNDEMKRVINISKNFKDYPEPYLLEAQIYREEKKYEASLFSISQYLSLGGEETKEITDIKASLKRIVEYEEGKQLIYDTPKQGLAKLLGLLDEMGDNPSIYYYIAVAYRNLENYEKAIYYLNESLNIDNSFPEVFNELGINYAALKDYNNAISYLRKAFEVTGSIEICTNLIMCYLNNGDLKNAKTHKEIAKKLDPNDEVLLEIESYLEKLKNN